jgi:hypothetical protein
MTIERTLRLIAGTFILDSQALGTLGQPCWYLFTAFVGTNVFQSGFTKLVPHDGVLRRLGVPGVCQAGTPAIKIGAAGVK